MISKIFLQKISRIKKYVFMFIIVLFSVFFVVFVKNWRSPGANFATKKTIHEAIHCDSRRKYQQFIAKNHIVFDVYWVENTESHCINPYFPSIHIKAHGSQNAWIHVVYTDAQETKWQSFIDSPENSSHYPLYSYNKDFYDAPLWQYSLFYKPLGFWKGQAFAVNINHKKKTIKCLGGISWGFALSFVNWRPKTITPELLDGISWKKAWKIIKQKLPYYRDVT